MPDIFFLRLVLQVVDKRSLLDGSTRAERAIPVAARLARASNGVVVLVRVVNTSSAFWPAAARRSSLAQQVLAADFAEAEDYLAALANSSDLEGVPRERVIRLGPTVSTILAVVQTPGRI